jgi:DNA-directed RNA polymerase specialized sigma24 family protein
MGLYDRCGPAACDSDDDANALLEQYDAYIIALAWRYIPRNIIPSVHLRDEVDELAQRVRIKFWQVSRKKHISSPTTYIKHIVFTEAVDMVRRYKPAISLSLLDEDAEHFLGNLQVKSEGDVQDPAEMLEQEEAVVELTTRASEEILALPQQQRRAIIGSLRDKIDDFLPLLEAFKEGGIDIEEFDWPGEREELQRVRASLSVARHKLAPLKDKPET